ncbi:hypothetical protein AB0L86_10010 [Micromonospora musae]|uniref:hypothetical protein n=1 Tax=Micromonospora musae TaxID=1894970 RepID=UPI00342AE4C1
MRKRLVADSDWNAEMAVRGYLDGFYPQALTAADRAVKLTRRILRRDGDERVVVVLIERLRWRAQISQVLGRHKQAVDDARAVLELLARLGKPPRLVAEATQLLLAESSAVLGDVATVRVADRAIEAFRRRADEADAEPLAIGEAFDRYARTLALIGEIEAAQPVRRFSVDAYRSALDRIVDRRERIRFATAVEQLADDAGPPNAAGAPDILSLLQDAAEQRLHLIPPIGTAFQDPVAREQAVALLGVLALQSQWLDALGAPQAAAEFARSAEQLLQVPAVWWRDRLRELRDLLEQTIAHPA